MFKKHLIIFVTLLTTTVLFVLPNSSFAQNQHVDNQNSASTSHDEGDVKPSDVKKAMKVLHHDDVLIEKQDIKASKLIKYKDMNIVKISSEKSRHGKTAKNLYYVDITHGILLASIGNGTLQ